MPKRDSRERARRELVNSFERSREYVKRSEGRNLSQREYADTVLGINPKTNKPYSDRALRHYFAGDRDATAVVDRAKRGGGLLNQKVEIGDQTYSVTLVNPLGASRLDLYRPTRRKQTERTARKALEGTAQRYRDEAKHRKAGPGGTPAEAVADSARTLRNTRGMRLGRAHTPRTSRSANTPPIRRTPARNRR